LGARVDGVDPRVDGPWRSGDLDAVLPGADAVTLHASLTESSRGLIDTARLDRLPAHAVVVNTARGELLDLEAAVTRVRDGRLGGLVADVFPVEPYPRLAELAHERVWTTPHSAGFVHDLGARVAEGVRAALSAWVIDGTVPYRVTSA
jgi:phosphoglycerate dehydrogenase-like enzyme